MLGTLPLAFLQLKIPDEKQMLNKDLQMDGWMGWEKKVDIRQSSYFWKTAKGVSLLEEGNGIEFSTRIEKGIGFHDVIFKLMYRRKEIVDQVQSIGNDLFLNSEVEKSSTS